MNQAIELADYMQRVAEVDHDFCQDTAQEISIELRRLAAIEQAALKLVKCKGRYHTEQNMIALGELLGVKMPPAICEKDDENE